MKLLSQLRHCCASVYLYVSRLLGAPVEEHLDVPVPDVLLYLLDPLVADAGGTDNEGGGGSLDNVTSPSATNITAGVTP